MNDVMILQGGQQCNMDVLLTCNICFEVSTFHFSDCCSQRADRKQYHGGKVYSD